MHGGRARNRREVATASRLTADPVPDLDLIGAHWASKAELGVGREAATAIPADLPPRPRTRFHRSPLGMHGGRARERREEVTASLPTADPVPDLDLIGAHWASKGELGVGREAATASRPTSRLDPELDSIGGHLAGTAVEHGIGERWRRNPGRPPTPSPISISSELTGHRRGSSGLAGRRRRHPGRPPASTPSSIPSEPTWQARRCSPGSAGGGDAIPADRRPLPRSRAHRSLLGIEGRARGRPGGGDGIPADLPPRPGS